MLLYYMDERLQYRPPIMKNTYQNRDSQLSRPTMDLHSLASTLTITSVVMLISLTTGAGAKVKLDRVEVALGAAQASQYLAGNDATAVAICNQLGISGGIYEVQILTWTNVPPPKCR